MTTINELKFKLLPQAPYSPNLAPLELDGFHYKQGIEAIERHWKKCIEIKEENIEEQRYFFPIFLGFVC